MANNAIIPDASDPVYDGIRRQRRLSMDYYKRRALDVIAALCRPIDDEPAQDNGGQPVKADRRD